MSRRARSSAALAVVFATGLLLILAAPALASDGTYVSQWGSAGSGAGQFNTPSDVAVGPSGDVYVVDRLNNRVQRFTNTGAPVAAFAVGTAGECYGIHVDGAENVYVADYGGRVRKYTASGTVLLTITAPSQVRDVVTDSAGNIYAVVYGNNTVRKYTAAGALLGTWTGFASPRCIAIGSNGHLYITEYGAVSRVSEYLTDGTLVRQWGSAGSGDGQFDGDIGVATGPDGSVYVTEYLANRIQKFTATGAFVTKWGSSGTGNGQFAGPRGIAVDAADVAYIADTDNNRIQTFGDPPTPIVSTSASSAWSLVLLVIGMMLTVGVLRRRLAH